MHRGNENQEEMKIISWRYWVWIQGPMALPFSILTLSSSSKLGALESPGEYLVRCRERNEPQVVSCNYQELLPGRWELFSVISVTSFCSEGILSLCLKKLS